jgi:hypothetical protein
MKRLVFPWTIILVTDYEACCSDNFLKKSSNNHLKYAKIYSLQFIGNPSLNLCRLLWLSTIFLHIDTINAAGSILI